MKIFYDEIDGELHPKLMIVPYSSTDSNRLEINLIGPFERMHPEDFHDDFQGLTISLGEMLRDPFDDNTFSIDLELVEKYLVKNGISTLVMAEIEYFVMLIDDIEELMQMNVRRFYLE